MDCSPPGSSIHGISQARVLEWVAIFFFFLEDMVDIPGHVFTRGMIVAVVISVVVVCLVTMGVIYRVDLVLFYRHFMGRDETLTGNECHNAGISYLTVSLRSYELIFTLCWLYCWVNGSSGEGNGNPLQYSGLGNPMDGGAWWATVHGVEKSRTRLSDFTFTFHFPALGAWSLSRWITREAPLFWILRTSDHLQN